jgi:hypothetical protein
VAFRNILPALLRFHIMVMDDENHDSNLFAFHCSCFVQIAIWTTEFALSTPNKKTSQTVFAIHLAYTCEVALNLAQSKNHRTLKTANYISHQARALCLEALEKIILICSSTGTGGRIPY